jgi:hypothetical protein
MNERFQELHNQARDFYLQDEYMDLSMKDLHRLVEQKFAELIVKECASMARVFHSHEYDFTGDLELHEFMLKHFGVEE